MSIFDLKNLLEIPIKGSDQKRAIKVIQIMQQISAKGGGNIPLQALIPILGFDKPIAEKIIQKRGDIKVHCPKGKEGKLEGLILNIGQPMQEVIPKLKTLKPEIVGEKRIFGRYKAKPKLLEIYQINGLKLVKRMSKREWDLSLPIRNIHLKPNSIAVF